GGQRNPMVLAAAAVAGVDRVFAVGGAQAVAALAYGTQTIPAVDKIVGPGNAYVAEAKRRVFGTAGSDTIAGPREIRASAEGVTRPVAAPAYGTQTIPAVDKIVGPGNAYVAEAKRRVFGTVGIDMIAGPSEILVIADGGTEPDWVAMDLFSQAEHDEMAQSLLLCPDAAYIDRVAAAIDRLIDGMPRRDVIRRSLTDRGALIRVRDLAEACEIANRIAPEHLELSVA